MRKIVLIISMLFAVNANAGNATNGELSNIHFMSNGVVIIYTNGTRVDVPSCASNQPSRFAVNGASEGGKVQVSGLLALYTAGKRANIYGTSDCSAYGDTETISYFRAID